MSAIAGQTAPPNWLNVFEVTQENPKDNAGQKIFKLFFQKYFSNFFSLYF